ncbi:MAG: ROK family transcriptional regulator [Anaerolineales bacterium]|nr:ROK family transcriptional regulator [Anaerolineales bacterium]
MFYWISPNQNIKNFNKHAVVDLIRFAASGISRTDLADEMGLTRAAVTLIVNDLLENGVILEAESRAIPSGRPPVFLEINPKRGLVAAIEMGATHVNIALADFSAKIIEETYIPLDIKQGPQVCLTAVSRILHELLDQNGIDIATVMAVGVGVPGPVITDAGMVVSPPIMPGWDGFPIRDTLQKEWGCPVSLNNDAELGALGEWAYGAGRGEKNLAFIKVGSGIGAGLIINQQIYGGTTGSAGEIGHLTIDENGPLCSCGNRGCMEAFAGGNAIALQAKKLVESGKRTLLSNIPIENLTAQEVAKAARRGDLPSQEIIMRAGTFIGIAIAGLVNLFNPGAVIIGGGVAQAGDLLTNPIRQAVRERSLRASEQSVHITTSMLGRRSALMGAVVQAINIAIHDATERKNPGSKDIFPVEIKQVNATK